MNSFLGCLRKDRLEYTRSHKNLICVLALIACATMVLAGTISLPFLLNKVMNSTSIFNEDTSLSAFMEKFFPGDLKGSMGILASDIGVFYGLLVVYFTFSLIPNDIKSGKIILPLCYGHSKKAYVLSKECIYSVMMSLPIMAVYMFYYLVGSYYLRDNYDIAVAFINAIVLTFSVFSIINITFALSVIFKNAYSTLALMVGSILMAPDALSFLKVGHYLPTYLLTFTYNSSSEFSGLIIPCITMIVLVLLLNILAIEFKLKIDVDERRC